MTSGSCRLNILWDLGSRQGVWARLWGNKRNGKALTSAQPSQMGAGEVDAQGVGTLMLMLRLSGQLGPEP